MNRYRFVLAVAAALVIVVAAVGIHPGRSAPMGTLYITPNDVNVASGTVTYKIFVDSVGASPTSGINAWNLVVDDHDAAGASLTPVSISIAGNLLAPFGTVTEIINCVNGGTPGAPPGPGNSGCDVQDGPGIVHTAAVLQGPATPTPISGLIATITYTALSSSPTTLGFVSTPSGGDLLTDGSSSPVPHTTRGASFATTSPDFVITATDSAPFNPGGMGSSTVTLTGLNGFTSSVSLTHTEYPPTGLTVTCPGSGTPSATGATVNCSFSSTTPGAYVVTVTGTSGSTVHLAPINVNVGDFSLGNPLPSPVKFNSGSTGTTKIIVRSVNGFSGSVSFSAITNPTTGLTVDCGAPVTVSPTLSPTVTCTFSSSTPGTYTATITGTFSIAGGGTITHAKSVSVTVNSLADFTISPSTAVTIQATVGTAATQTITLGATGGFTGTVSLSVNTPLPAGLTCNPVPSVTLPGATMATLSCTASTAGDFPVIVKGTSGTLSHSTGTITFHAVATIPPDFTISPSTAVTVQATVGTAATQTITLAATNGFTGTVTLSTNTPLPAGLACNPIPSVTLPATTAADLKCTASMAGDFPVTVTGMSGSLSHSTGTITFHAVAVTPPDFTISPTIATTVQATVGTAATQMITLAATNGFTGTVTLATNTPLPTGLACSPIPSVTLPGTTMATLSCTASAAGDFAVTVTGTSGTLAHSTGVITFHAVAAGVLSLTASPNPVNTDVNVAGTSQITVHAPTSTTGTVAFQVTPSTGLTCDPLATVTLPAITTTMLSCKAATAADYTVGLVASIGSLTSQALTVNYHVTQPVVQTLSLSANPNPVSATVNVAATSQITVTATGGLTGAVSFTVTPQTGLVCPAIPGIAFPVASTATLSCTAASAGSFTAQVKATVGTVSSPMLTVTFNVASVAVPDFDIVSSSTGLSCSPSGTATSTISITAKNGFAGTVALTATAPNGFAATFNPTDISGTTTSTLTVQCSLTAPIGTSTITVHGTSSPNLSHSIDIGVVVIGAPRFILAANPMSVTCNVGDTSKTSTISATGQNGFTGTAALSVQSSASGVATGTLSSSAITVGVGSVTLNINCTAPGSATLTVAGNGGGLTSSATVTVTVSQSVAASFTITAAPTSLTCHANGGTAQSTITVTGVNGFNGLVLLTSTIMPDNGGIGASLTHGTITGSGESTLNVQCFHEGMFTINVEGLSGGVTKHAPLITVTVTPAQVSSDFAISANPGVVSVEQGGHTESTITVTSLNSFAGTVDVSASFSCANVHVAVAMLHVRVTAGSSGSAKLMINADANASLGLCTVTVTGVSGSLSHSATVKVTVVAKEKNECVETGDDDNGHHRASDEKTTGKDRDDDDCDDAGQSGNSDHDCVATSDEDAADAHMHNDKTTGKDRDDDECMEEGQGHECKGDDNNGLGDARDARDRDMKTKDDCVAKCHDDNESVEGAEHENSRNDCMTSGAHGTDNDDNAGHSVKGSRDSDVGNQGEALVSLTDSDRWTALDSKDSA